MSCEGWVGIRICADDDDVCVCVCVAVQRHIDRKEGRVIQGIMERREERMQGGKEKEPGRDRVDQTET